MVVVDMLVGIMAELDVEICDSTFYAASRSSYIQISTENAKLFTVNLFNCSFYNYSFVIYNYMEEAALDGYCLIAGCYFNTSSSTTIIPGYVAIQNTTYVNSPLVIGGSPSFMQNNTFINNSHIAVLGPGNATIIKCTFHNITNGRAIFNFLF